MNQDLRKSPDNQKIAAYIAEAFGGTPRYTTYTHRPESLQIEIVSARDRPGAGVTSFSTVGLSDHPMIGPEGEFQTRLELAGACENGVEFFPDMLAAAAFGVIQTGGVYYPGAVILNCVRAYAESSPMAHLYLSAPFLWEEQLKTLDCATKRVSWLLIVPISESEYLYRREHGAKALEEIFEQNRIDIFNVYRAPVL